jgi:glycosidase
MTGLSDPDNRRMMRFGNELNENEKKMLEVVRGIVKVREKNSALRYGDYYTLLANDKFYSFIRSDFDERVLVVLNKSDEKQNLTLSLPSVYSVAKAVNLVDGSVLKIDAGKLTVELSPRGWVIIKLE